MASILMQTSDETIPGLMMDGPLTVPSIIRRAAKMHPHKEIVSRFSDGSTHRYTYADVFEAAVVGRPDALRGEAPVIFVVLCDPAAIIEAQTILDTLRSGFERWQLPRLSDIMIVNSLPRTGVGKIDKKELRLRLAQ